jgi:hypothetical protein
MESQMNLSKVVFIAVVCAALGFGQAGQEPKQKETKPATTARNPGGKSEGIKVHGHWVLDVRNPDGTLASRKEFENALLTIPGEGSSALATLLAGGAAVGGWYVALASPGVNGQFIIGQGSICSDLPEAGSCVNSLTAVVGISGTQLILQGTTAPFPNGLLISSAGTTLLTCSPGLTPAACLAGGPGVFKQWDFTQVAGLNQSVLTGQTVTVTVTLSFS